MPRRLISFLAAISAAPAFAQVPTNPPPPELIVTDTRPILSTADGGLRPVVGVHNIQVARGNRTAPDHADKLAHTYLHAPMLAWWRGHFYIDYLSAPVNEHDNPTDTSFITSPDGVNWSQPRLLFAALTLPGGEHTIMHQRTSFYVAPGDRLLATGFHGKHPSPNDGTGVGRVVREIKADGMLGPVYFIRLSRHNGWTEKTAPLPLYTTSPDTGFVAACAALLADKRYTSQWWEEERITDDGFYDLTLKAVSTVRRPDGSLLAVGKDAQHATSTDNGRTWTRLGFGKNLPVNASKYWLQRTSDSRYVLALNPTNRLRFPLAVATATDAKSYGDLLTVHSELNAQRFPGTFKNLGPQYVRGIHEGNGTPPGSDLWLTYSVNKEDIWIARVPVPIAGVVTEKSIRDDFTATPAGTLPAGWNIYSPLWAPVRVVDTAAAAGHALELRDEDPYDYARAVRVFPATHGVKISFKVFPRQANARLEIEVLGPRGERASLIAFGEDGHLWLNHEGVWVDNGPYAADRWLTWSYTLPKAVTADRGDWLLDGKATTPKSLGPVEATASIERLSFRTGEQRGRPLGAGRDLPGADVKSPAAVFLIDDVDIAPQR